MIKEFCEAWEKNNGRLREYISSHDQGEYSSYKELVCKLFEHCINPYMENLIKNSWGDETFSIDKITEIDNGDYQGTLLFIIPRNIYINQVYQIMYSLPYIMGHAVIVILCKEFINIVMVSLVKIR